MEDTQVSEKVLTAITALAYRMVQKSLEHDLFGAELKELFQDEAEIETFCNEKNIDRQIFDWLIGCMAKTGRIISTAPPIVYTEKGLSDINMAVRY